MQVVVKFPKYISNCWPISIILQNNIQPISGLWQRCHDDCDPICQLMFYVLVVSLSGVYPRSSPPLPVKSFCSSTIWRVTKEEQFYFFIGVQESEFSVCLMLLNILRLKESAWISQCVSRLLSISKCYTHALVTSFTHIWDKDVSITKDKTWSRRGVTR